MILSQREEKDDQRGRKKTWRVKYCGRHKGEHVNETKIRNMNATKRVRGSEGRPQLLGNNNLLDHQSLLIQIIEIISYLKKRVANILSLCYYPMIILLLKYYRKTCFGIAFILKNQNIMFCLYNGKSEQFKTILKNRYQLVLYIL